MRRILLLLLLFHTLPAAASPLADSPSPYLALHADDPVAWQVWDESLLQQARKQRKLLFISSGYYACHWCHVMQRESFRDEAIAAWLNKHFIPVKIDRELWPELDSYLNDFVASTRGSAGWPLSVFITPEGHPLVGTTYLPPEQFYAFVQRLQRRWQSEGEELAELARRAARESYGASPTPTVDSRQLKRDLKRALLAAWEQEADMFSGGFGQQAKFPKVPLLEALMPLSAEHEEVEEFLRLTLKQMAEGGLRDQLGGGFFRYTVDPDWQEPHFEKMLVDNAQLVRLYFDAAGRWDEPEFAQIAQNTLDFILSEMRHREGAYITALSAIDDKGVEGGYYLWHESELVRNFGRDTATEMVRLWGMHSASPWEAGNLPLVQRLADMAPQRREHLRQRLLQQRTQRTLPRDEKRLAAANGMLLSALSRAPQGERRYRKAAGEVRDYLLSLWDGETLWRMRDSSGQRVRHGGLGDYAAVAQGLIDWAAVSGDVQSRQLAAELIAIARERFWRSGRWRLEPLTPARTLLPDEVSTSPAMRLLYANSELGKGAPLGEEALRAILLAAPAQLLAQPLDHASYLHALRLLIAAEARAQH